MNMLLKGMEQITSQLVILQTSMEDITPLPIQ
jgi:hypothetical protein